LIFIQIHLPLVSNVNFQPCSMFADSYKVSPDVDVHNLAITLYPLLYTDEISFSFPFQQFPYRIYLKPDTEMDAAYGQCFFMIMTTCFANPENCLTCSSISLHPSHPPFGIFTLNQLLISRSASFVSRICIPHSQSREFCWFDLVTCCIPDRSRWCCFHIPFVFICHNLSFGVDSSCVCFGFV